MGTGGIAADCWCLFGASVIRICLGVRFEDAGTLVCFCPAGGGALLEQTQQILG